MVKYADIEKQFRETLGYVQEDLARIRKLEPGVNYAAAALIVIACEIIAKYRDGRVGADAFKRLLPCDERCQKMGKKLYEALRNGLVHGYDTQDILVGSRRIGLAIAWRDTPHLSVMRSGAKPCLVLNIQDLFDRLSTEIDAFRRELESQAGPRDRFFKTFGQNKDVRVEQDGEVQAWLSLINESPAVASSGLLH